MLVEVKNYTKPNILLLGPTGSGKTYLLRNLAATWNKEVADECGKVLGCLVGVHLGLVTVPFWEYWTSPYSSHYRPYT